MGGPVALEAMLGVLGLKILLIEDDAATRRTLALREPVVANQHRFGSYPRGPHAAKQLAAPHHAEEANAA
jgi:hypothetical protein